MIVITNKMIAFIRASVARKMKDESGQVLLVAMAVLLLGSLVITPMLSFMTTGVNSSAMYWQCAEELYAADAGIEDGMWQIKYNNLATDDETFPGYHPYDYTNSWSYDLSEQVNNIDVNTTIRNIWIPWGLTPPSKENAERIIQGIPEDPPDLAIPPKVIITGSMQDDTTFEIKIQYYHEEDEELLIDTIGIWLPPGFHYNTAEDCSIDDYYESRDIFAHAGGEAVVWDFEAYPFAGDEYLDPFPGVYPEGSLITSTITFQFTNPSGRSPEIVSWIDTNLDLTQGGTPAVKYTWDADIKVYSIISVAGETEVEAYTAKNEMREMGSSIPGDYRAIGNPLMRDQYYSSPPVRDTLLSESSTILDDIPYDATVQQAWLYWSGWLSGDDEELLFEETCSNFGKWGNGGSDWTISHKRFRGHHVGNDVDRYLILKRSLDLSEHASGEITISWDQSEQGFLESTDGFDFSFSGDGGDTWSEDIPAFRDDNPPSFFSYVIPEQYRTDDFKFRFFLQGCTGSDHGFKEYVYVDNIRITAQTETIADTSVAFSINDEQVYFDDGEPAIGDNEITTPIYSVLENKPGTYSYACKADVTGLVAEFSTGQTGNAKYTIGNVSADTGDEWSYAGWSLIIIYTSAETMGHQLYLYDEFIYVDNDETLEFPISGFLTPEEPENLVLYPNAAKATAFVAEGDDYYNHDYFKFVGQNGNHRNLSDGRTTSDVWNSWSLGMSEDGIDVDTFNVRWVDNLMEPGDTSAKIEMSTGTDSWNLVYIILAFRSETVAGGTMTYLIR